MGGRSKHELHDKYRDAAGGSAGAFETCGVVYRVYALPGLHGERLRRTGGKMPELLSTRASGLHPDEAH